MNLLNRRVTPPILTNSEPTTKLTTFSTNYYVDPEDSVCFDPSDLTPEERGHVYIWKEGSYGDINIHTPYRIMDAEQAKSLNGLTSFLALPPYITGSVIPERRKRDRKFCLQDFKLSVRDFTIFSETIKALGYILEKDEVDYELFLSRVKKLTEKIKTLHNDVSSFRKDNCLLSGLDNVKTEGDLRTLMQDLDLFEKEEKGVSETHRDLAKLMDKVKSEAGRAKSEIAIASSEFEELQTSINNCLPFNWSRMSRELIHKNKVKNSADVSTPSYINPLSIEIRELAQHYPVLNLLKIDQDSVSIEIASVKIKIEDEGKKVTIDGDLTALKPYLSGASLGKATLSPKRRRTIFAEKGES